MNPPPHRGDVKLTHVSGTQNVADILTKGYGTCGPHQSNQKGPEFREQALEALGHVKCEDTEQAHASDGHLQLLLSRMNQFPRSVLPRNTLIRMMCLHYSKQEGQDQRGFLQATGSH